MTLEKQQRGSLATEVVLLVPVLMLMVMCVVLVGRVQSGAIAVRHAADVGARSGSVAHIEDASRRAFVRATDEMSRARHSCESFRVHTETKKINGEVMVIATTECVVQMGGLSFLGLSGPTVRGTSMEVVDHFRSGR
jgi:Flp pilus assembly protein TadG